MNDNYEFVLDADGVRLRERGGSEVIVTAELEWSPEYWKQATITTPAFVNGHTHPLQSASRFGTLSELTSFEAWLQDLILPSQAQARPDDFSRATAVCLLENLEHGNADVSLHCKGLTTPEHLRAVLSECERWPIRSTTFLGIYPGGVTEVAWLREMVEAGVETGRPTVQFGLGPVNLSDFETRELETVVGIAREYGLRIHVHVSETARTRDSIKRLVALQEDLRPWDLVHCIHEKTSTIMNAIAMGAKVVLCPRSNQFLGVGLPPVTLISDAPEGTISIGSDGASSGITQSVTTSAFSGWVGWASRTGPRPRLSKLFRMCQGVRGSDLMTWRAIRPVGHPASLLLEFMADGANFSLVEAMIEGRRYELFATGPGIRQRYTGGIQ